MKNKSNKRHKKKDRKPQAHTTNASPHLLTQTPQAKLDSSIVGKTVAAGQQQEKIANTNTSELKPSPGNNGKIAAAEEQAKPSWLDRHPTLRHFVQGLVVVGLLVFAKTVWVEHTRFGKQVEQITVSLLQQRLEEIAPDPLRRVAVVDITALQQVDNGLPGKEDKLITPRDQLAQVVDSVAAAGPEAIGIDVYFELDAQGRISPQDEWFLDHCLDVKNKGGMPIFVGVHRSIARGNQHWLDYPRFAQLGTAIVIPRADDPAAPVSQLFTDLVVPVGGENVSVDSVSFALYKVVRKDQEQRWRLGAFLHNYFPHLVERESLTEDQETNITTHRFNINFGPLERIIRSKVSATAFPRQSLRNKIVLIGRGTAGETSDMFNVPGQGAPVPGVYVHAAAVNTLVESPLFTLSQRGHVLADLLAALIPLMLVFFLDWRLALSKVRHARQTPPVLSRKLPVLMALVVVAVGYALIQFTGIYWTDFLLVVIALLVHGKTERFFKFVFSNRQG